MHASAQPQPPAATGELPGSVSDRAALEADRRDYGIGVPAVGDVLTSALAAAELVAAGERVLVCGGPGIRQALERRGAVVVDDGPCEAVMVGFHRDFTHNVAPRVSHGIDVLVVDAAHDYESVKQDLADWLPKMRPGGTVLCHDYTPKNPGVVRAVSEVRPGATVNRSTRFAWWQV